MLHATTTEMREQPGTIALRGDEFSGVAIAWGDSTAPLAELNGYRETFKPNALRWDEETAFFMGHDFGGQIPLARVGSETLKLRNTDAGLEFSAQLPESAHALREALHRGDLRGAVSIGFRLGSEENAEEWNNHARLRTVNSAQLHHIALVHAGAYPSAKGNLNDV